MKPENKEKIAMLLTDMVASEFGQGILYDLEQRLQQRAGVKLDPDETPIIAEIAAFRAKP